MKAEQLLGIEIGGTKLQLVLGNLSGEILERRKLSVDVSRGGPGIREQIEREVRRWRAEKRFAAAGVGFGGPVNWATGEVARSHQVEGWSGFNMKRWLQELVGAPVQVENDANTAALGEAVRGAGKGIRSVFYVTLGSGVGGGLVINGEVYHGASPGECEIGHVRLDREGTIVENVCSGWAVDRKIRDLPEPERGGELWNLTHGMMAGQARHLPEALLAGDLAAQRILGETAGALAFALSHVTHLLHPDIIVLGGGLSGLGEPLRLAVQSSLRRFIMEVFQPGPQIALSALWEDAVPAGALELARLNV
jgi:glucokinase